MVRYRIEECEVCGVLNPTLVIRGWVENAANEIIIKGNDNEVIEKKIEKYRSRISTFNYKISLGKSQRYDIYFQCDTELVKVTSVLSTSMRRVKQKLKPQGNYKNRALARLQKASTKECVKDPLKEEQKEYCKETVNPKDVDKYTLWLKEHTDFCDKGSFEYNPKISIVMPVYNVPGKYLALCLDSILNQTYQNFEICIADDCSKKEDTIETLKYYMNKDERIKVVFRTENGHISRATNSALEIATGEFIGLMDNDDKLEMHALSEVVKVLNENKDIDFIYSDEDKINMDEVRSDPHFKSDFALDTLYGGNYICHFSVIRKSIIDKIEGFRVGYEGAQDFDLFLRITNETDKIHHIPKVLYHWRMIPGSTAVGGDGAKNYAALAGKKALEDYFSKKNISVNIDNFISTHYFVEYLFDKEPKVEIIIYNYNEESQILKSIEQMTAYKNYTTTCIDDDVNKINEIVEKSTAEFIVFMDNKCNILTIDWLDLLVGYASQENIGVAGAKVMDDSLIVRETGIVLTSEPSLIPATIPTYRDDYGYNGRLLIPFNYTIIENKIFSIQKSKFIPLDSQFSIDYAYYDLNLNLIEKGYRNVFVPQIELKNSRANSILKSSEIEKLSLKHPEIFNKDDPYYNLNFSMKIPFRMDI